MHLCNSFPLPLVKHTHPSTSPSLSPHLHRVLVEGSLLSCRPRASLSVESQSVFYPSLDLVVGNRGRSGQNLIMGLLHSSHPGKQWFSSSYFLFQSGQSFASYLCRSQIFYCPDPPWQELKSSELLKGHLHSTQTICLEPL